MARKLQLAEGCNIRFPDRGAEFDQGVEAGILAAQMDLRWPRITRVVGDDSVEQIRVMARRLGYRLSAAPAGEGLTTITLESTVVPPALRSVPGNSCGE